MPDLIMSLLHYHRHVAIYVVLIIDTVLVYLVILGRIHVSFTGFAFYIAVRCCFDKHLYPKSCLNAHNHNTCIRLPQTVRTARKSGILHY